MFSSTACETLYEAHIIKEAVVGSDLTFRYEGTKYSLPQEYVGKTVSIRIYPYRIGISFCVSPQKYQLIAMSHVVYPNWDN